MPAFIRPLMAVLLSLPILRPISASKTTATPPKPTRPHIVVVIADDHGVYHSSPYGADWIKTPNMQALADDGMLFHRAYVASPSCGPSRAALLTGLMPYNSGIVGNHERNMKPGVRPLMADFDRLGYDIIWRGKVAHGRHGADTIDEVKVLGGSSKPLALDSVRKHLASRTDPTRPVLAMIGCRWPHRPWPHEDAVDIPTEQVRVPERTFDTPETRSELTRYVAAVESVDQTLGETQALIKEYLGEENTIVIYTSDHGQAWPFGKWSLYETGIRTSLLVKWPGHIPAGQQTNAMVSWIDLLPTLIDLAGGDVSDEIDGRSFRSVLLDGETGHRDQIFAVHKGDTRQNVYPCRSLRIGDWKYILNLHPEFYYTTHMDLTKSDSPFYNRNWPSWVEAAKTNHEAAAFLRAYHSRPAEELYNVTTDPFEKQNLAADPEQQQRLEEMRKLVRQRMREVGDDESLSGPPRFLKDYDLP
ncbi:MAG: sulfatase-like hydrolase/transferase [Planctomycetaceae bacterium]|nr:sulfatase-like hydrolase/transferase [Planctomycetaceae bacterium]